jgi:hypothetical protein
LIWSWADEFETIDHSYKARPWRGRLQHWEAAVKIDLTTEHVETLLQSPNHSRQRVADAPGTPENVRKQELGRLEAVERILRNATKQKAPTR